MRAFLSSEEAFEATYDQYASMLYRLALSRVNSREDAEDVVQEVFLKLMASYHKIRDDDHARAWLVRVTINQSNDCLRRKKQRAWLPFEAIAELAAEDETPSPILSITMDPTSAIPDKIRSVILLHYLEGYPLTEVATMLGISHSAAKMRLARGRKILEELIQKEDQYV